MMHDFLLDNRDDLVARCKAKVAQRLRRGATDERLRDGVPLFLDQLIRTLRAERQHEAGASLRISGASGGDAQAVSEIGVAAAAHGTALLALGYTVDQVVHDYGDLCQAIGDLAHERRAPFNVDEYRTLNRCLDNAIADAVTEFSAQRDAVVASRQASQANEKLGVLVHELRNSLQMASLAATALEVGGLTLSGATGSVLRRSLAAMRKLVDGSLAEVRARGEASANVVIFALAPLIREVQASANLEAAVRRCMLKVDTVDPMLRLHANRDRLQGALANLLSNAFKFSHADGDIRLSAYQAGERILIDVEDSCGGLLPDHEEKIFAPFLQFGDDRSGLGLGLSIARQNVESDGGALTVKNRPGIGCVFTIALPNCTVDRRG